MQEKNNIQEQIKLTGDTDNVILLELSATTASHFIKGEDKLFIPSKLEAALGRNLNKKLKEIDPCIETAKELVYIIASNLSMTYHIAQDATDHQTQQGWKKLKAKLMRDQVSDINANTYKKIIELLEQGTAKGGIMEVNNFYKVGEQSRSYRLTSSYFGKGIVSYTLKTDKAKSLRKKSFYKMLKTAMDNPIARSQIELYGQVQMPTIEEIKEEANRLIESGHHTKKGKRLTKRDKSKFTKDQRKSLAFVSDAIELYKILTVNGFLVPVVSSANAGHRVITSLNLLPSWIRSMVKLESEHLPEVDFGSMHPCIASSLFGDGEQITHTEVADFLGVDRKVAKVEHLSFFNKRGEQMVKSPLWAYYAKRKPVLLDNLIQDKSFRDYKKTSAMMFKKEVDIMTDVIVQLQDQGISCLYIFDALAVQQKHIGLVSELMVKSAAANGVNATV